MTFIDPKTGLADFSKKPLFCLSCNHDVVFMGPLVVPFYKVEGGQATVGGTPCGTGFICAKCRRVMSQDDIMRHIAKREAAPDEEPAGADGSTP